MFLLTLKWSSLLNPFTFCFNRVNLHSSTACDIVTLSNLASVENQLYVILLMDKLRKVMFYGH